MYYDHVLVYFFVLQIVSYMHNSGRVDGIEIWVSVMTTQLDTEMCNMSLKCCRLCTFIISAAVRACF